MSICADLRKSQPRKLEFDGNAIPVHLKYVEISTENRKLRNSRVSNIAEANNVYKQLHEKAQELLNSTHVSQSFMRDLIRASFYIIGSLV
jgi:hypothetical protein